MSSAVTRLPTPRIDLDPRKVLDAIDVVVQPIIDVATGAVHAAEALARFPGLPGYDTESVFVDAHRSGFGFALEAACVRAALTVRETLPADIGLTINISPDVLCHPMVTRVWPRDLDGVIIEVTEQDAGDTIDFRNRVLSLRRRGARIAVDDVSTGYAGLLRLATLYPDYVKVDRQVVTGVRDSLAQTAVLETLVGFSHRLGAAVIGEGVEALDDLLALAEFDVDYAQGWTIGRPNAILPEVSDLVVEACQDGRRQVLAQRHRVPATASRAQTMFTVAAELASADVSSDLSSVIAKVAEDLGVDLIGVSLVDADGSLREIATTVGDCDPTIYDISDYPATAQVLRTGNALEIQANDTSADPAERALMDQLGHASLLIVPVCSGGRAIGVLEFAHNRPRRWSTVEIAHARGLAENLGPVLSRRF